MQTRPANSTEPAIDQVASPAQGLLGKWTQYLQEPIDGASLAVFRICFGLAMIGNLLFYYPGIHLFYIAPQFNFSFIQGLHPWPGNGMYEHFAIMGSAALCIALGAWCRPAALVFCLGQTYLLLVEKAYYQNHLYLICLLAFLLVLTPANRVWSFDNLSGNSPRTVPRWSLLILKAQIFIVYFFGGVAKLNSDWFHGEPLATVFRSLSPTDYHGLGQIVSQHWFSQLITWGGIAIDFSIGFLLWCPATFWLGAVIALAFHLMNSVLFPIGVFPWLMIATIGLFAPPDWPRRIFHVFRGSAKLSVTGDGAASNSAGPQNPHASTIESEQKRQAVGTQTIAAGGWATASILLFLHVYLLVQILVPLRHFLYPGDVSWTEQGHRFSWQMMLRGKQVKELQFLLTDPVTGKTFPVGTDKVLNIKQKTHMETRPDMILQYAHYLADTYQAKTHVRPVVKVTAIESLNFRSPQYLIDPNVDLAAQTDSLMPASWIVPLAPPTANPAASIDGATIQSSHVDDE